MSRQPKADVAIYAPLAAPLYVDGGGHTGGAEIQTFYLARALADAGLRVKHIVEPLVGQRLREPDRGVEAVAVGRLPGARVLARRRGIAASLAAANARLYIQRSAGYETAMVGTWARLHRRVFVFSSSSEGDFLVDRETALQTGSGLDRRSILLQYRLGIRLAHLVVAQTERQRELARTKFGIDSRVLRSFAEVAPATGCVREAFLWVGGLVGIKDPLAYLELARRVPEARFWMVVTDRAAGLELGDRVRREAATIPNLELLPARPRTELLDLYRRAVALVNTSRLEGFPNTFLEAWARGTSVLSLGIDPDGVIEANDLGVAAGGAIEVLAAAARARWESRSDVDSEAAQEYIHRVHDPAVVGRAWVAVVRELTDR